MHVEVVTNIIPTMNDDDAQLGGIAGWIAKELGTETPWHVTRFHPNYMISDLPATPVATLEHAYELGRKAGLKFIYRETCRDMPAKPRFASVVGNRWWNASGIRPTFAG